MGTTIKDGIAITHLKPQNSEGGIPEAPADGKQYARQDKEWSEVDALPEGGTEGQILTKTEEGAEWADAPASDTDTIEQIAAAGIVENASQIERLKMGYFNNGHMFPREHIANNLTTSYTGWALGASQGKKIQDLIDTLEEIISTALNSIATLHALTSALAPAWNGHTSYDIGDVVSKENSIYESLRPNIGAWNDSDWKKTNIIDYIKTHITV